MLIFWNFLLSVAKERNETIIFIFSLFQPFPTYFGLKRSHNRGFLFFEIFCYFFGIFYYALGGNETERHFLFSLFLDPFQPILAWNNATMVFFDFFEFPFLFLEFSLTRPVGREWKENFYFSLSRPFPTYFGLKWCHNGIFLIYWIFLLFFLNFL